jgi:Mor family transcriptional regulator
MTKEYPEILADLADSVSELMKERGVDESESSEFGIQVAETIRMEWGGMSIYIPKGTQFDIEKRDKEIFSEWNGQNTVGICRKHKISTVRLYQIIQAVRLERRAKLK